MKAEPLIGFVGLGVMGKPMAVNLLNAGYRLNVYDIVPAKADALSSRGAIPHDSPASVAAVSDIVFVMVCNTDHVNQVVAGELGIIEGAREGTVVVVSSTADPSCVRDLASKLGSNGIHLLDAPVSGGEEGAISGNLAMMVGGDVGVFEDCRPVLMVVASNVVHIGDAGSGQLAKACNQIVGSLNMLAVSEGLVFAAKAGLDLSKLLTTLQGGVARSWALINQAPKILSGDFAPGFTVELQQKDLKIALSAAREMQVALPGCELVHQLYREVESEPGGSMMANHALIRILEKTAGCEARVPAQL